MIRTRLIPALLLLALGWTLGLAVSSASSQQQQPIDSRDINICYRTNGTRIETSYVDVGTTAYYPIESHSAVEATSDGFVARHEAWFELRPLRTLYLPGILR